MASRRSPKPTKRAVRTLAEVVADGDLRSSLVALRDELAKAIEDADTDKVAPLARQLRDVLADLDTLSTPEVSEVDELRLAREQRRAAKVPSGAGDGVKRGRGGDRSR